MIDEKGKLFGKINIVDLLVIVVIAIAAIFLGVKFLGGNDHSTAPGSKTHVVYTAYAERIHPEVYENIKACVDAGDAQLMASGELLDGHVTAVTAVPHEEKISVSPSGQAVIVPVGGNDYLDLTFTIECNVVNPITTEIGTQEVRIGKTHIVKTDKFEVNGAIILSCRWGDGAA